MGALDLDDASSIVGKPDHERHIADGRHRYHFKVFALDINLDNADLTKESFYAAIKGHILARGEIIGTYEKQSGAGRGPRANMPSSTGDHQRRH